MTGEGAGGRGGAGSPAARAADMLRYAVRADASPRGPAYGPVAGAHRSAFRGRGVEFADLREYRPGDDDVRAIDWNVTARLGSPHVREFAEDRETRVYIVLDVSGSLSFGSGAQPKAARAAWAVAGILAAALSANDAAAAFFVGGSLRGRAPLGRGRRHALRLLAGALEFGGGSGPTDLESSLARVASMARRRGSVFIVSDFEDGTAYDRPLRLLCARHDVTAVRVRDRREAEMPDVGRIALEDAETGEQVVVDTSDARFRRRYAEAAAEREASVAARIARAGARYVAVDAGEGGGPAAAAGGPARSGRMRGWGRRGAGGGRNGRL